jgi:hypothetical protein
MRLKAGYTTSELSSLSGLSRHQVYRLRRRYGLGRIVYLTDLRDLSERDELGKLWESIILREQLSA